MVSPEAAERCASRTRTALRAENEERERSHFTRGTTPNNRPASPAGRDKLVSMPPLLSLTLTPIALLAQTPPTASSLGGTGEWLFYGVVLIAVAAALFAIEVFLPTGGVIGVMAGLAAVAGVFCLFKMNTTAGALGAGVVLLATPVLLVLAVNIWPDTPFGQWVTHTRDPSPPTDPADGGGSTDGKTPIAAGDVGRTATPLRPVGVCILHGRRQECFARSGGLDVGVEVEVVSVSGHDIYVRPVVPRDD